jgi:hypothetical protein
MLAVTKADEGEVTRAARTEAALSHRRSAEVVFVKKAEQSGDTLFENGPSIGLQRRLRIISDQPPKGGPG